MSAQQFAQVSKKRKFINNGVFYAELNEFLRRELANDGYAGVNVRVTPARTEIIITATNTKEIVGENRLRIRELTAIIQKRFGFADGTVELFVERIAHKGLSAAAQCESIKAKLLSGFAVRRAAYGVMRTAMEGGAKGCEVIVSGKLRAARAKAQKFTDGFMIHSGQPSKDFIDYAVRHVEMKQGVLGIKVKIMLPTDERGVFGPKKTLPDAVTIIEPKDEDYIAHPVSEIIRVEEPVAAAAAPVAAAAPAAPVAAQ